MRRKFCFVFIVLLSIFAFSSNLFAWFPESIYLSAPGCPDFDDEDFRAKNTQTYGWVMNGEYTYGGIEDASVQFVLCTGQTLLVNNIIDVEDLPLAKTGVYSDSGSADLIIFTNYSTWLDVDGTPDTFWNNHAIVSNWEITKGLP